MSLRPKWYATRYVKPGESDWMRSEMDAGTVWTVGPLPDAENWCTDSGSSNSYGMNKADAERVAELWNRTRGVDNLSAIGGEP